MTIIGEYKLTGPWRSRGYLPHFDGELIPQFITFRLADTLPKKVLDAYRLKLEQNVISEIQFHELVDDYLDQNAGAAYLRSAAVASIVQENLLRFDDVKYKLHACVIMPNHGHIMLMPKTSIPLSSIMHSMKSYTANRANELLSRSGAFWAREYFDRYIRNGQHFANTVAYIHNNPVKAKLCSDPSDWPFSSSRFLKRADAAGGVAG